MKSAGIAALLILPVLAIPVSAQEIKEFRCGRTLETPDGFPRMVVDDQLHVLDQTRSNSRFDPGLPPAGTTIKAIFCARSDIVPAPSDYKVLQAGYPLTIYARDEQGKTRIAILDLDDGRLRLRSIGQAGFTSEMVRRIQAVLDQSVPQFGKSTAP